MRLAVGPDALLVSGLVLAAHDALAFVEERLVRACELLVELLQLLVVVGLDVEYAQLVVLERVQATLVVLLLLLGHSTLLLELN